jgi:hypothetical protein
MNLVLLLYFTPCSNNTSTAYSNFHQLLSLSRKHIDDNGPRQAQNFAAPPLSPVSPAAVSPTAFSPQVLQQICTRHFAKRLIVQQLRHTARAAAQAKS